MKGLSRILFIFGAFALGAVFNQLAALAFLLQYLVMAMLFFAFLTMPISGNPVRRTHFWILVCNLALGFVPYLILKPFSDDYALIAFLTGITPTAVAAPVIILLIHRNVTFVATSVLITNLSMALILPFTLPFLAAESLHINLTGILSHVLLVMIAPLGAAFGLRFLLPKLAYQVKKAGPLSFFIWVLVIWITVAKTTVYFKNQDNVSWSQLLIIAAISLTLCILGFFMGYWLGGKNLNREAAQSLGHKNVVLSIWVALTYLNPLIALGPTFYILFHHVYNGYLLWRCGEKKT